MMSSRLDARELQRKSVHRMLHLALTDEDVKSYDNKAQWKALVYDKQGQDIIAPLFTVGSLRSLFGVTLHRSITSERSEVPDVPCIYFLEPTEANIQKMIDDCKRKLYPELYVNFTSSVPRPLLEKLAFGLNEIQEARRITSVVDRFVNFVALGTSSVSLNLEKSYQTLRSSLVTDDIIEKLLDSIATGILSLLVTLKVGIPIIRCPPNDAAQLVAQKLHEKIYDLTSNSGSGGSANKTGDLFQGSFAHAGEPRPVLCLLDRDLELGTMLAHTWTYESMCQDVLGMRLNKLSVIENEDDPVKAQKKTYDIDPNDKFWSEYQHVIIHEQFEAVDRELQEFNKKHKHMQSGDLNQAITQLPEMQERKRSLEMHTNIAHSILKQIQKRALDRFYVVEDQYAQQSVPNAYSALEELLKEVPNATQQDKMRAILVLFLTKSAVYTRKAEGGPDNNKLSDLLFQLDKIGASRAPLAYLEHIVKTTCHKPQLSSGANDLQNTIANHGQAALGQVIGGQHAHAVGRMFGGLLNQAAEATMRNLEKILPTKRELLTTKIVKTLMENRPDSQADSSAAKVDNYVYLDPKLPPSTRAAAAGMNASRYRASFKRSIVCMVGGGNFVEAQQMQEAAKEVGKECIYVATNFASPEQFLEEITTLGAQGEGCSS
ncbi:unnamed protein product [Amoebophrya sp. A120]|nr:unnamed protein product [Amoebophrya sp. A120]|eukprot:GSA120T00019382001.1